MHIPVFQKINELHHATETMQETVWNDFHIYRNEDADQTCVNSMEAHRCNFFQISIDQKSDYALYRNARRIHTADNIIYFAPAGSLISWKSDNNSREWKGYNIIVKHDFLSAGINNSNFRKEFPFLHTIEADFVTIPPGEELVFELCERMLHEQQHTARSIHIIRHYMFVLLYTIKRIYMQQHQLPAMRQLSAETELAGRFEELVNEYYLEYRSINNYASRLFVSPKYLSQVTKNVYGKTAKEMIMARTGEEASALLLQTNLTLSQIAARLDFSDTSNFIKFFKKQTGQGPSAYRQSRIF